MQLKKSKEPKKVKEQEVIKVLNRLDMEIGKRTEECLTFKTIYSFYYQLVLSLHLDLQKWMCHPIDHVR